jgi:hypothetical protein
MKYDDASWHYGGDFPKELPDSAGATHIGMFLAWALLSGLAGEMHTTEFPEGLEKLQSRTVTPGQFLLEFCDEKFTDEDLNEEGNAFTAEYFEKTGEYLNDYEKVLLHKLPSAYHVPDTWTSFDKLKPILDQRFNAWRRKV